MSASRSRIDRPRARLLLTTGRVTPLGALVACSLLASGCGLGAGPAPSAVHLIVTRDFGASTVRAFNAPHVEGQETVMSLLTRNATVSTRFGGGFVQSVDGLSGGQEAGRPVDWFYYVNGVEAPKGAAETNVHGGDHIWWDRHDWSQTDDVPAVVGSFPEPFLNGIEGKRLPVRVECASVDGSACRTVTKRLRDAGVPAAVAAVGGIGAEPQTLRVAVAPYRQISGESLVSELARGPAASGVYVQVASDGGTFSLLDQNGRGAQTLGAGTGLIAATRNAEDAPLWVVTGTDEAGVERAAQAFSQGDLHNRFALAVTAAGATVALPVGS